MFKCLKQSLDIDIAYSVNSFLYALSKLPGFKNIISSDVYTDKTLKKIEKNSWFFRNVIFSWKSNCS